VQGVQQIHPQGPARAQGGRVQDARLSPDTDGGYLAPDTFIVELLRNEPAPSLEAFGL
jgi:hypothetical protein